MLVSLVTAAHVFICVLLVSVVLLQQGKGADMGATFGGGSQTVFGASGADNLLTRVTTGLAFFFMVTSIFLALSAEHRSADEGRLFENAPASAPAPLTGEAPAAEETSPAPAAAPAPAPAAEAASASDATPADAAPADAAPIAAAPAEVAPPAAEAPAEAAPAEASSAEQQAPQ